MQLHASGWSTVSGTTGSERSHASIVERLGIMEKQSKVARRAAQAGFKHLRIVSGKSDMSNLDAFKSKWSGRSMCEQDRRALFWYLRRASSYTAWKRQADAFDRFASVVELQVRDVVVKFFRTQQ